MTRPSWSAPRAAGRALRKLTLAQRRRIEAAVQAMLDTLDAIDAPTEELEEDDPAEEDDPREDDGAGEPSLGSSDRMTNQERSYRQRQGHLWFWEDAEDDPAEGREGDDDRENDPADGPLPAQGKRGP